MILRFHYLGNSGLARLATTARGEEASKLFEGKSEDILLSFPARSPAPHLAYSTSLIRPSRNSQHDLSATSTNPSRTTTPDIPTSAPTSTTPSSIHQPHPTPFSRAPFEPTDRSTRGPSTPAYPDRERAGLAGRRGFVDTPDSELDGFAGGAGSPDEAYRRQLEGMMAMLGGGGPPGSGAGTGMGGFGGGNDTGMGGNPLAALLASMNGQGQGQGSSPLSLMDGPGSTGGFGPGASGEDPMAAMLQAMSGSGGPGGGPNPFANFGPGGAGPGGFPPGLFDGTMGAGGPGGPGAFPPGMEGLFPASQPTKKSFIQRLYPFLHVMVITALWVFVVFLWEPALSRSQFGPSTADKLSRNSWLGGMKGGLGKYGLLSARGEGLKGGFRDLTRDLARQAGFANLVSLAYGSSWFLLAPASFSTFGWSGKMGEESRGQCLSDQKLITSSFCMVTRFDDQQPVFWAFTTVEVLLQSTRFMLFKVS